MLICNELVFGDNLQCDSEAVRKQVLKVKRPLAGLKAACLRSEISSCWLQQLMFDKFVTSLFFLRDDY